MNIAGKSYPREELLKRSNNLAALCKARRMTLNEGRADGLRVIEVQTAGGLRLLLSEDRCLDILELSYNGVNISYLNGNGAMSNAYACTELDAFASYWSGGMLLTCGLRSSGPGNECDGEIFPLHGRIGVSPAEQVGVSVDDEKIVITGVMRETKLGVCNLELRRRVEIHCDGSKIVIQDEAVNNTGRPEPLFLLYHINFGFPFLDEGTQVQMPKGEVKPRTPDAEKGLDKHLEITAPIDDDPEQVFFHLPAQDGPQQADVINENLGIKASVRYNSKELPVLTQWKSMQSGNYALGIEPGNSFIRGRDEELKNGFDKRLAPYGSQKFQVEIELSQLD